MMPNLDVTSPMMTGPDVKELQTLLNGTNVLHTDFHQGTIDGVFGPETGRSCIRAKYWFGYPNSELKPTAGPVLFNLLTGKTAMPTAYKRRRTLRLKKLEEKPLRLKALERAKRDVGKTENPKNSNTIYFTRRWGFPGPFTAARPGPPYCAMGVSIWYLDVGSKAFREKVDWAYVPYMIAAAVRGLEGLALARPAYVKPGDIVCFDWDDDGVADHTGLVRGDVDPAGNFETREANTSAGSSGSQSDGGGVYDRVRNVGDVHHHGTVPAFIHVGK